MALRELPAGLGDLTALQKLDLFGCTGLTALPESFGKLRMLLEFDLSNCTALQSLPASFGELRPDNTAAHASQHLAHAPSDLQSVPCPSVD